ncbi:hypothetical protein SAMN02745181_1087 [Rubritalea squalenifaciens DSM 18772]|uniref:Uncharacterized protein n=1 Tax=Rubritalea squalenifaciens DSM 18772 TaxID=1123071 RepID=A0A1M6EPJ8_9BACT|nr:hypothetical protein [Rubritalea squalenifaciens]SHI87402.1 hypothetical protein SAMN02745181_1087 [Rubritalea squalenifaciens DSM 18772]
MKYTPVKFLVSDLDTSSLSKRLRKFPYTLKKQKGFRLENVTKDFISARFIYKLEELKKIQDPMGHETEFLSIIFQNIEFEIYPLHRILIIHNLPRSSRYFFSLIEQAFGPQFSMKLGFFNMHNILQHLKETDTNAKVTQVSLKSVRLNKLNEADVTARGDNPDQQLMELYPDYMDKIHDMTVQCSLPDNISGKIKFTRMGSVTTPNSKHLQWKPLITNLILSQLV